MHTTKLGWSIRIVSETSSLGIVAECTMISEPVMSIVLAECYCHKFVINIYVLVLSASCSRQAGMQSWSTSPTLGLKRGLFIGPKSHLGKLHSGMGFWKQGSHHTMDILMTISMELRLGAPYLMSLGIGTQLLTSLLLEILTTLGCYFMLAWTKLFLTWNKVTIV